MIETRRLKNVVIFIQAILSFVLSRKIINIYKCIAWKSGNFEINHIFQAILRRDKNQDKNLNILRTKTALNVR